MPTYNRQYKLLDVPKARQTFDFDCGATALQVVLGYYGIEARLDNLIELTRTSPDHGLVPEKIVQAARRYGLKVDSRQMAVEDVREYISHEVPVILAVQAWKGQQPRDWSRVWMDGHFVVAMGYTPTKMIFEDPAVLNRVYLTFPELELRWHDLDSRDGTVYRHHGIAIYGRLPVFDESRIRHMES